MWSEGQLGVPLLVQLAFVLVVPWVHAVLGEGLWGGATIGKRLVALRVVVADGSVVGPVRALLRRLTLDLVLASVLALGVWLAVVRRHGFRPALPLPPLVLGDYLVSLAFVANLFVFLLLCRALDRVGRFPHDWLVGAAVVNGSASAVVAARVEAAALARRSAAAASSSSLPVAVPPAPPVPDPPASQPSSPPPVIAPVVAAARRRKGVVRYLLDFILDTRLLRGRRPSSRPRTPL